MTDSTGHRIHITKRNRPATVPIPAIVPTSPPEIVSEKPLIFTLTKKQLRSLKLIQEDALYYLQRCQKNEG